MKSRARIALLGDYSASVTAQVAIPPALKLPAEAEDVEVESVWVHTSKPASEETIRSLCAFAVSGGDRDALAWGADHIAREAM